jgi:ABC-type transporter Mla maintaining outer membrane lipid asymmetry ATPase subunit MlaF
MSDPLQGLPMPDFSVADPGSHAGVVLQGLTKSFQGRKILDDLDFTIVRGETVVIIGRSGEGKSVMLKHIVRLMKPESRTVWIDGENILQLQAELNVTSIVVTHDMASAFKIADRVAMLSGGRIIFAEKADLARSTGHPVDRHFN